MIFVSVIDIKVKYVTHGAITYHPLVSLKSLKSLLKFKVWNHRSACWRIIRHSLSWSAWRAAKLRIIRIAGLEVASSMLVVWCGLYVARIIALIDPPRRDPSKSTFARHAGWSTSLHCRGWLLITSRWCILIASIGIGIRLTWNFIVWGFWCISCKGIVSWLVNGAVRWNCMISD